MNFKMNLSHIAKFTSVILHLLKRPFLGQQLDLCLNSEVALAVNKSYCDKIALGEITIGKCTRFKFLEIDFVFTVSDVIVL
jgi:hypothetical protein